MSMPRSVAQETPALRGNEFADDVAYFLSLTPRQLPSRYLYDGLGSALFDAICHLPWYDLERIERRLLARHGDQILRHACPLSRLVEFGPGTGVKLATLLGRATRTPALSAHLIDVSADALDTATRRLSDFPGVAVIPHVGTYEVGLSDVARSVRGGGRTLTLFLGSNVGNFDPPAAHAFLAAVRGSLVEGDLLLLGADLIRAEAELLAAYDDPLGVTAAFNRNLLVRANRELGADFDIEHFAHRAVWNVEESRVEMHLVSQCRQSVRVPASNVEVAFDAGDIIWTESSYKYRPDGVCGMLRRAGFTTVNQWIHEHFALTLAQATEESDG
jgi:L-histidine Nalpha-methyltransferase